VLREMGRWPFCFVGWAKMHSKEFSGNCIFLENDKWLKEN